MDPNREADKKVKDEGEYDVPALNTWAAKKAARGAGECDIDGEGFTYRKTQQGVVVYQTHSIPNIAYQLSRIISLNSFILSAVAESADLYGKLHDFN